MRSIALFPFLLLAPLLLHAAPEVSLRLSPAECMPGDVVELTATLTSPTLAEFELKIPKSDALHLASRERLPLTYRHGTYTRRSRWLLQPTRAGSLTIGGITASITRSGQTTDIPLPSQTLEVRSCATTEIPDSPLPLPDPPARENRPLLIVTASLVALAAAAAAAFLRRRGASPPAPDPKPLPTLDSIREQLAADTLPAADIERLLQLPDSFHPSLRPALEQAVYSRSTSPGDLLAQLNKEVRP